MRQGYAESVSTDRLTAEEALRESEANFRALAESAAEAILIADEDGRHTYVNRRAEDLTGFSRDELLGRSAFDMVVPADRAIVVRETAEHLAGRPGRDPYKVTILRRDGGAVPVEIVATHMTWKGKPATLGMMRDITERRRMEREVLEVERREQQRIGRDLHDSLGQELTGLAFLAGALQKRTEDDDPACSEAAARIAAIARSAVAHARQIAHGLMPVGMAVGGLQAALERFCDTVKDMHGVECTCRCLSPDHTVENSEVATHLFYIVQEAVRNAWQHAKPHCITITAALEDGHGTITVEDDGQGVVGDISASPGLGLRIMRYRAEMIDGHLTIEPRDPAGTTVTCTFIDRPVAEPAAAP